MIKDTEIFQIYEAMEKICIDVNSIINALDQIMKNHNYKPYNGLRWDTSESLNSPLNWLPYFSQRTYYKDDNKKKVIGINIIFKDAKCNNKMPFIACGMHISNNDIPTRNDLFYCAGWDDPTGLIPDTPFTLTSDDVESKILTYFIPLTSVKNIPSITELIVNPLTSLYDNLRNFDDLLVIKSLANNIKFSTITIEEIRG